MPRDIAHAAATPARDYAPGIGEAVANRTINRKRPDGTTENWADVAFRVAVGNTALRPQDQGHEFKALHHHLRQASVLMSGRSLQHGDETQPMRPQEVFTNCATAATSFATFLLLMSGSGVGRCFDDDLMLVDWSQMPLVVTHIRPDHPDVLSGEIKTRTTDELEALLAGRQVRVFDVPDSREGWAQSVEVLETMAYEGTHCNAALVLDFSGVRERGAPIKGMQNRPASGPGPLMSALNDIATLRATRYPRWLQAMWVDHYLSECVLVGGARRSARIAAKSWRDKSVIAFAKVKAAGGLWSANNSLLVDEEFWRYARGEGTGELAEHARELFRVAVEGGYRNGEPGFINQDKLVVNDTGLEALLEVGVLNRERYPVQPGTARLMKALSVAWAAMPMRMIINPCSEIVLCSIAGFCVVGDIVPLHATSDEDALDAFRVGTRAMMRLNTMTSLYQAEVERTNRIGISMTGLHEYAIARFGYTWHDLIDEARSLPFWQMVGRFKRAVDAEAVAYARELGLAEPHTTTTAKPSGSVSKLFNLSEGVHLPARREYLRWVQFRTGDPLIDTYRDQGHPVRVLRTYKDTVIVGFPTRPLICTLAGSDKVVTAAEATPAEQYQWLRLLEKWWIRGVEEDGVTPLPDRGNQVSYTLKFDPATISLDEFKSLLLEHQSTVRCCSVMPQSNSEDYEYLPEEDMALADWEQLVEDIATLTAGERVEEDIDFAHIACAGGACPIAFNENTAARAAA
jgi:ribonucleoside-triphosphate reductase (formate)